MTDLASLILTPNAYQAGAILGHRPSAYDANKVIPIEIPFTRSSVAMRRNKAGLWEQVEANVPRLNWNVGGTEASWLFEAEATNYAENSTDISLYSTYQATVNSAIANDLFNGKSSYLLYPSSTGSVTGQLFKALLSGITNGEKVTIQAKVKAEGKTWAYLGGITGGFTPLAWFNLSTGVVGTVTAGMTARISPESNGYYTIEVTGVAAGGTYYSIVGSTDADNSNANTVNGTNGIRVAYIGVEKGNVATSPIITAGSAVTRVADAPIANSFSNVIPQTEGGFFLEFEMPSIVGGGVLAELANISSQNLNFQYSGNTLFWYSNSSGFSCQTTIAANTRYKALGLYKANAVQFWVNGVLVESDLTSLVHSSLSKLSLGCSTGSANHTNIKIFKSELTPYLNPTQAEALTTI